jgi:hypothetical protein
MEAFGILPIVCEISAGFVNYFCRNLVDEITNLFKQAF